MPSRRRTAGRLVACTSARARYSAIAIAAFVAVIAPGADAAQAKYWLGPNYRGTHSTSRGLGTLLHLIDYLPVEVAGPLFADADAAGATGEEAKAEGILRQWHKNSPTMGVLELGCGEGRALGQLAAKYPGWRTKCFNLKGYKNMSKHGNTKPIGGAVSFDTPEEVQKMLDQYKISLGPDGVMPSVHLGDATHDPWPFEDNSFGLMLSQATMTKMPDMITPVKNAARTLAPGGMAFLGFGGTMQCTPSVYAQPLAKRTLFCGDVAVPEGGVVRTLITLTLPPDREPAGSMDGWLQQNKHYSGGMPLTLFYSKQAEDGSYKFECPSGVDGLATMRKVLKGCTKYTPQAEFAVKTLGEHFNSNA